MLLSEKATLIFNDLKLGGTPSQFLTVIKAFFMENFMEKVNEYKGLQHLIYTQNQVQAAFLIFKNYKKCYTFKYT